MIGFLLFSKIKNELAKVNIPLKKVFTIVFDEDLEIYVDGEMVDRQRVSNIDDFLNKYNIRDIGYVEIRANKICIYYKNGKQVVI